MHPSFNPKGNHVIARAVAAALPLDLLAHAAPYCATKTHTAPQSHDRLHEMNPPRHPLSSKPLSPRQLTAVRFLLAGHRVKDVAQVLKVDPYTVSRWKNDPRFQAEFLCQSNASEQFTQPVAPGHLAKIVPIK